MNTFILQNEEIKSQIDIYFNELKKVYEELDRNQYIEFISNLEQLRKSKKMIFAAGNGGSFSNADHLVCDLGKNLSNLDQHFSGFRAIPLSNGNSTLTAIANDMAYSEVFSKNLELLSDPGDALICLSVSGASPNILSALNTANRLGVITFGIYGFNGGEAERLTRHPLLIKSKNFGIVEDIQAIIFHTIVETYKAKFV
jgi:D-sedoheptulose 7-phosphate isomerase